MADHACSHLVEAMNNKGWDYNKVLPSSVFLKNILRMVGGVPISRELDCPLFHSLHWQDKPTPVEFNAILKVLGIDEQPPKDSSHTTTAKS
ncbi:hypothetical protein RHS01_06724 [Rhizoctonia solani]|uniref:Uncharacterized protein n=1 Tax=Rhizoctonia solani TaxID=456999 RepID=A0A8H7M422_9AGAM|nr:hypothetical protein RHS01_06724 [Rhizoctonia solani]